MSRDVRVIITANKFDAIMTANYGYETFGTMIALEDWTSTDVDKLDSLFAEEV